MFTRELAAKCDRFCDRPDRMLRLVEEKICVHSVSLRQRTLARVDSSGVGSLMIGMEGNSRYYHGACGKMGWDGECS